MLRVPDKSFFQSAAEVLGSLLPKSLHFSIPLLEPYLITSFGSFGRIDYGTGHEVSFAHLILCLVLLKQISLEETNCRVLVHVVFKK
jgi:serine/threonine-protein phosphatase 2A activator